MDVNAAVAAAAAIAGVLTGVIAMLAFRWSEREQKRPTRTSLHTDPVLAADAPHVFHAKGLEGKDVAGHGRGLFEKFLAVAIIGYGR